MTRPSQPPPKPVSGPDQAPAQDELDSVLPSALLLLIDAERQCVGQKRLKQPRRRSKLV